MDAKENQVVKNEIFTKMYDLNYSYENVVKVLLATIESLDERMPISIFNESRAFTDHLARCYVNNTDKKYIDEQLDRAERHLNRMIMDCYKELFIIYYRRIEDFKKYIRRIDLSYVSDGKFYVTYKTLLGDAELKKIEAKKCVSYEEDYLKFEEACPLQDTPPCYEALPSPNKSAYISFSPFVGCQPSFRSFCALRRNLVLAA